MAKINLLKSNVYNKIAAGEVIERPSSVIKELLDNSIDAGSNDIKIAVKGGGIKSIFVKDNGGGIAKGDLKTAFLTHATSKINSEDDLSEIMTLGFRGEALASIAAVSMVEIKSSFDYEGAYLKINGGDFIEEGACSLSGGTHIKVENLFFNTPVRLKFLKSERAEESHIKNMVSRYILCNPDIRISLEVNGKNIYQSSGKGLSDAVHCIYGKDVIDNIINIEYTKEDITLFGYIGFPSFSKPNRTYQTISLNGRYIINGTISAAITNAYKDFLLKRQYPFYVLHLGVPHNLVDVNVHPNKMDVRFQNDRKIFSAFFQSIYGKLNSNMQSNVLFDNKESENSNSYAQSIVEMYNTSDNILDYKDIKVSDYKNSTELLNNCTENVKYNNNCLNNDNFDDNKDDNNNFNEQITSSDYTDYKIVGSIYDTYIILQASDDILLIDQHAAHERILYEKYRGVYAKDKLAVQYLIVPYLLNVNTLEYDFLLDNIDILQKSGFNIELFGDRVFKVSSVPAILTDIDLNKFFADLLKDTDNLYHDATSDTIKEKLMKKACGAAVKAGEELEKADIDYIVKKLFNNTVLLCPHGRPIVIKYKKQDIEKLFKRII